MIHEIAFPFILEEYDGIKDGEEFKGESWRPGTRMCRGDEWEVWSEADAMGKMVLEVVSMHKPGKYPERTFYLRSFIDPTGRKFGKQKMRVISSAGFKAMLRGYRHPYDVVGIDDERPATQEGGEG